MEVAEDEELWILTTAVGIRRDSRVIVHVCVEFSLDSLTWLKS